MFFSQWKAQWFPNDPARLSQKPGRRLGHFWFDNSGAMGQFFLVAYRHQPTAHGQSWSSGDFASNGVSQSHLLIMSISLSHFQFWSAYVGCTTQYKDAISKTWEQIDVVHRMVEANPATFEFVTSAQGPHLLVYKVWNVTIDFLS